jgi:hypothetical protein
MISTRSVSNVELSPFSIRLRILIRSCVALVACALFGASLCRAQSTYTAASSNESDVQAAVNKVSSAGGDTVNVPCTPAAPVWTTPLTSSYSFTLNFQGATPNTGASTFGAGTNCVTIVDNNPSGPIINLTPTYQAGQVVVIQNVNIDPASTNTSLNSPVYLIGAATSSGFPQIRVDNVTFGNGTRWTEAGNSSGADWMIRLDDVVGVLDHNTIPSGSNVELFNDNFSSWLGVGQYGDNSWAQPDSFGTANNLFVENNIAYVNQAVNDCDTSDSVQDIGGCRFVARYNHVFLNAAFSAFYVHGLDTGGRDRSGREQEVYENTITCISSSGCNGGVTNFRGGTGLDFGNTLGATNGGFYNWVSVINVYRIVYADSPWGACGGSGPYDQNDGTVYFSGTISATSGALTMTDASKSFSNLVPTGAPYSVYDVTQRFWSQITSNTGGTITIAGPISESGWTGVNNGDSYEILRATACLDQAGRGAGNYLSGATPSSVGWASEVLDPIYQWDDTKNASFYQGNIGSDSAGTIANRDWYTDNSAGQQTSPISPFNGTSGVGWGTTANRPPTCAPQVGYWATDQGNWNQSGSGGQGELFVCTAPNTWTLHYEPYTYPHPLVAGNTSSGTSPQPPTNLSATVN